MVFQTSASSARRTTVAGRSSCARSGVALREAAQRFGGWRASSFRGVPSSPATPPSRAAPFRRVAREAPRGRPAAPRPRPRVGCERWRRRSRAPDLSVRRTAARARHVQRARLGDRQPDEEAAGEVRPWPYPRPRLRRVRRERFAPASLRHANDSPAETRRGTPAPVPFLWDAPHASGSAGQESPVRGLSEEAEVSDRRTPIGCRVVRHLVRLARGGSPAYLHSNTRTSPSAPRLSRVAAARRVRAHGQEERAQLPIVRDKISLRPRLAR